MKVYKQEMGSLCLACGITRCFTQLVPLSYRCLQLVHSTDYRRIIGMERFQCITQCSGFSENLREGVWGRGQDELSVLFLSKS